VALTADSPPRILLHPTGAGESREVPNERQVLFDSMAWLPDGKRFVAFGSSPGERSRGWLIDAHDGTARPFTEEGVSVAGSRSASQVPVASPDGTRVVGRDAEGHPRVYPLDGGPSEPVPGVSEGDHVLQWTDDGGALFVGQRVGPAWKVRRLDLRTGRTTPWTEIAPGATAGLRLSSLYLTPNGRFWVHDYSRLLTDLYVAAGIR
jgi:Tol biopolymer transport system component